MRACARQAAKYFAKQTDKLAPVDKGTDAFDSPLVRPAAGHRPLRRPAALREAPKFARMCTRGCPFPQRVLTRVTVDGAKRTTRACRHRACTFKMYVHMHVPISSGAPFQRHQPAAPAGTARSRELAPPALHSPLPCRHGMCQRTPATVQPHLERMTNALLGSRALQCSTTKHNAGAPVHNTQTVV